MHKLRFVDGVGIRLSLSVVAIALLIGNFFPTPKFSNANSSRAVRVTSVALTQDSESPAETVETSSSAPDIESAGNEPAEAPPAFDPVYSINNIALFVCAVLVLLMQAGFALVEVGLNSPRNTVNILYKNLMDLCIGAILFYLIGYGLMYPNDYAGKTLFVDGYLGFGGVGIYTVAEQGKFAPEIAWFFQAAFAATAATIVSGAVAGRMKFSGYLIYSAILTAIIYPISGYWKWGGGWLELMGFKDFAGSAVVHGVGGFAGLAGAMILGPRTGRFVDGKSRPMPGHNLVYAALGVFVLWVGWYGFNPGSQLDFRTPADISAVALCAVNTTLAAAAGGFVATVISWGFYGKPDLSLSLNGVLGGLVGITACCDCFTPGWSIAIGSVAGLLVILGVILLERFQIDDPVGAWPVHGLCGIWGCMAIGIFPNTHLAAGATSFVTQLIGTVSIVGWSFVTMSVLFLILKSVGMLRVSAKDEEIGLDIAEHGMHAYYDTETRTAK